MNHEEVHAALAKIQPGDKVTVLSKYRDHEAEVTGVAWGDFGPSLFLGDIQIRRPDGRRPYSIAAVLSHEPAGGAA